MQIQAMRLGANLSLGNPFSNRVSMYPLRDASGDSHQLVCVYEREFYFIGGPPFVRMVYFLFAIDGRLEDGGSYNDDMGFEAPIPTLKGDKLTVKHEQPGVHVCEYTLACENGPFFQQDGPFVFGVPWLDGNWSDKSVTLSFTRHFTTVFELQLFVEKGRLNGKFLKDGAPAAAANVIYHCNFSLPEHFTE
jgi:hypothetical protein